MQTEPPKGSAVEVDRRDLATSLVDLAQEGDREAFGRLVGLYESAVIATCRGLTRDAVSAEDLAIEAFSDAYLNLRQLLNPARFGAWVCSIARNIRRGQARRRTRERDALLHASAHPDDQSAEIDLSRPISELGADHAEVLTLHYWKGLRCEDIADFLDIPLGTVLSRLHRAREAIRPLLPPDSPGEHFEMEPSRLQQDVALELDLLAQIRTPVDEPTERLTLLLERRPERFALLVRAVNDGKSRLHLGRLIRRLRTPIMEAVLSCWFSNDPDLRARTGDVLDAWILHVRNELPRRDIYAFLDLLLNHDVSDEAKTELLGFFVTYYHRTGDPSAHPPHIISDVLACFEQHALDVLSGPFFDQKLQDGKLVIHGIPAALEKIPDLFCESLLEPLTSDDRAVRDRAAIGFRRAARRLNEDTHAELIDRLVAHLGRMWDAGDPEDRVEVVKHLRAISAPTATGYLRGLLSGSEGRLRRLIVGFLAERGCEDVYEDWMEYGRTGAPSVRRNVVETLVQRRVRTAKAFFRERMDDTDPRVRTSAIIAFGLVADPADEHLLQNLMRSDDKKLARTASRALYGGRKKGRESTDLETSRIERIRGDAEPEYHMSPIDGIMALPELRPYPETELSQIISRICTDWATTRRHMVMGYGANDPLMTRENSVYELTDLGQSVWRVGQFLKDRGRRRTVIGRWKKE